MYTKPAILWLWIIVSDYYSILAILLIFTISFSQCFAMFHLSCSASFADPSFARFDNYFFHSFTFVLQDLQGLANKVSQGLEGFCNRQFADVSPNLKNCTAGTIGPFYWALELRAEWPTHYAWTQQRIHTASLWHHSTGVYNSFKNQRLRFWISLKLVLNW